MKAADTVEIHLNEMPQCDVELMCRTISAAVHRLLQDPKNREDFERWRKARAGGKIQ